MQHSERLARIAALRTKLVSARVPLEGSIELTQRCNFRCVHCYLGDQTPIWQHADRELTTRELLGIIDQVVEAGTLTLTFTGGDPMLRDDFEVLYRHAVGRGLKVTVFSNGSLVSDAILSLFAELPPRNVEVSIYGATRETFDRVAATPGGFDAFVAGIESLATAGVPFLLKSVLMRLNAHELQAMEAFASSYGVKFKYDTALFAKFPHAELGEDAHRSDRARIGGIVKLRVVPDQAVSMDTSTDDRREPWTQASAQWVDRDYSDKLYQCGAASTSFHIDAYGYLHPCVLHSGVKYDLRAGSFLDGWNGELAAIRELEPPPGYDCNTCEARRVCTACPAMFALENSSPNQATHYYCETTIRRFRELERHGALAGPRHEEGP